MERSETNRLEAFRQFKMEIRGSTEHLIVGIDVAKDRHYAFMGTATGKVLYKQLVFDNNREGFEKLILQVEAVRVRHGLTKVVFGLEPTANYHRPLGEFLIRQQHMVVLVASDAVKKNRSLLDGRWDKHDNKDADNIADLISQGKCLYYEFAAVKLRELKNLLSMRRKLKKLEHGLRLRVRNHLVAQYFPELDPCCHWAAKEGLAVVRWCFNPMEVSGLTYEEFLRRIHTRGQTLAQQRRLSTVWNKAAVSIGSRFGPSVQFEADKMVSLLNQVRQTIHDTDEQIKQICLQFESYRYLLSIPGFGPSVCAMVLAAIGDPFRFSNASQVLKMVGLDLSASRSGKYSADSEPRISKKGKAEVRYGLYQAALVASNKDKHFTAYFTHKLTGRQKEKGIKTKMRVKLTAKMLIIAWTLMKKKEFFDPQYLKIV